MVIPSFAFNSHYHSPHSGFADPSNLEPSDDEDDLIITSPEPRLTSLICDIYQTRQFVKLPIFSTSGIRILPTRLHKIAGTLIELNFTARMARASSIGLDIHLSSLHIIHHP